MRAIIQRQRAEALHRLHSGDGMLVLVNAWDAVSARLFEQAGSLAIATTSAGIAWSLGYSDGEQVSVRLVQLPESLTQSELSFAKTSSRRQMPHIGLI